MTAKEMDYQKTLNLPKTKFPMKADLPQKEPEILKFWEKINLFTMISERTKSGPFFVLHDGPPYANGDIHLGHTLNKVLKDIIVKYKSMQGYNAPFIPGWDCHGQPIEYEVEKKLGSAKQNLSLKSFRKKCKTYALKFVARQKEQFKRLGIRGNFEKPYLTLDPAYEATNIEVFEKLYQKGIVYKGKKPVHWCYHCQTALAEAEIEYEEEKSDSIYVKFPLESSAGAERALGQLPISLSKYSDKVSFVIWTTTPWTLPANVAVALHPKTNYALVKSEDQVYILAQTLAKSVFQDLGEKKFEILKSVKGKELEHLKVEHPLKKTTSKVVLADFVELSQGTGVVHIAPGHGEEDYLVGLKYNLEAPMPVDEEGYFIKDSPFAGKHIFAANPLIIERLKKEGLLLKAAKINHSYPHCWRCQKPVIFRATEQWFISMDKGFRVHQDKNLRKEVLKKIPEIKWIPSWSKNRILGMLEERPDWCLSRQRAWGVPLPIFYCQKCGNESVTKESLKAVQELFLKEGADSWFEKETQEILPEGTSCSACGGKEFNKEKDIFDVWFESGVSFAAVLKQHEALKFPADLYLEGSDQHRGWFQSALLTAVGSEGKAPYAQVLTHGFLVDERGRKMSKSLGNVIDPLEVIKTSGADILRLWTASSDYSTDVAVSPQILEQTKEAYRKIRNTFRFLLGNLYDFIPQENKVASEDLEEIDKWALHYLQKFLKNVKRSYDNYRFHLVYKEIYNFCTTVLSAFYLDVLKDRLYTSFASSKARRSAQTVLFEILISLVKLSTPILSFTAEEVWQNLPPEAKEELSVQLTSFPRLEEKYFDETLGETFEKLLEVREEVLKALEAKRAEKIIGNSLEAKVSLYCSKELYLFLKNYQGSLASLFIVSEVELKKGLSKAPSQSFEAEPPPGLKPSGAETSGLKILVSLVSGEKCKRCWNYSVEVGLDPKHKNLCRRCAEVVEKIAT